ncbi:MAG TPA: DAK2 domain-containing protein [Anaerolineaceae bacterium]|nr:DAK2 domain-containing protein [Anaerolineaceae bacterium]
MTEHNIDLVKVFSQVSKTLAKNKQSLNEADSYNHDHGDHMVDTFQTITRAMKTKKGSDASEMLKAAAQKLGQNANNGSAHLYSQGLQQAAAQFQGKNVDAGSAMTLLQTLLSAGQPSPQQPAQQSSGMGDLLGSLLGGSQSTQQTPQQTGQAPAGGDLLGSLLGGLTGSTQQQSGGGLKDGLDMGDLVTAGMAFFQSKQQGKTVMNSLIDAFVAGSGMGTEPHRQQSTQLVTSTFMNALGKMTQGK